MKKYFILSCVALSFLFFPALSKAMGEDIWVIETGGESAFVSLLGTDYNVTTKTTDEIKQGVPSDVELLIYPGGLLPITQAQDADLQTAILDYVNSGGNYFGSCGGSIPGAQQLTYDYGILDMIGLMQVNAIDYMDWPTVTYTDGFIFNDNAELNGEYVSGTHWLAYTGGPAFDIVSGHEGEVEVLATYATNFDSAQTTHYEVQGKAAIVSAAYGLGKVILCAPHPESDSSTQFVFDNMINWLLAEIDYTPAQVTGVKVPTKYIKARQAKLKWDAQEEMSGYVIKLYKKTKLLRTIKITENIGYKVIKKLRPESSYKVKVRAKRTVNEIVYKGSFSKIVSFKTKAE